MGTWEHGTGVTSSHGRRTRYIYTAIRAILWSLPFPTFHFHYTFIRLILTISCFPSQLSVCRPCITATHITSSSSCQQFYHKLQQQQQDAAGIKTSKLLSNCQLYCQLCIQFLSFPWERDINQHEWEQQEEIKTCTAPLSARCVTIFTHSVTRPGCQHSRNTGAGHSAAVWRFAPLYSSIIAGLCWTGDCCSSPGTLLTAVQTPPADKRFNNYLYSHLFLVWLTNFTVHLVQLSFILMLQLWVIAAVMNMTQWDISSSGPQPSPARACWNVAGQQPDVHRTHATFVNPFPALIHNFVKILN